ncbi:MAG: helix-turn-helix domain-containing protein, partial [Sedimentisphaerales bacterium]|nr:helix-turn-helix domain-containing protein [Sedimentisphaerales bacterium]
MAGMFYSLSEAAEKLKKTKDEVKKLVKEGQLREFRDGPNVLFKVEEVEALMPDVEIPGPSEVEEPVELAEEELEMPELTAEELSEEVFTEEPFEEAAVEEPAGEDITEESLELEPEPTLEAELEPETEKKPAEHEEFQDFDAETAIIEVPEEEIELNAEEPKTEESAPSDEDIDNILLGQETGTPPTDNDLTDGDTALTGQGTSILGQTDNKEYELTDDTMADTVILDGTKADSGPEGLKEAEEDVSLDSFGSGSGLLDLSLQADDTSLGGILDEIYTDESKEPSAEAAEHGPGEEADISAEPEEAAPAGIGEETLAAQPEGDAAIALGVGVAQIAPDSQSNILGMLLFVPMVAVLYALIVVLAGNRGVLPSILTMIQDWVWPLMGVLAVAALIITAAAFMLTG